LATHFLLKRDRLYGKSASLKNQFLLIYLFIYLFIYSFIHSFIHPLIH